MLLDFLKFFVPLAGAAIAWFANERQKRSADEYTRKERKYGALIDALQGFYVSASTEEGRILKERFLSELNKCWLYCPDDVIQKAYAFLDTVHIETKSSDDAKEKAAGEFMLSVRQDLLSRKPVRYTSLTSRDFRHLTAN